MSKPTMEFVEWVHGMEVYSSRFERLLDEFKEVEDAHNLLRWLEAAYQAGQSNPNI